MSLINEIFEELFTKKGAVTFISGSAGGMLFSTSVEGWRSWWRLLSVVATGGISAYYLTGWVGDKLGAKTLSQFSTIGFLIGFFAMIILPKAARKLMSMRIKTPKIVESVMEDAKDE